MRDCRCQGAEGLRGVDPAVEKPSLWVEGLARANEMPGPLVSPGDRAARRANFQATAWACRSDLHLVDVDGPIEYTRTTRRTEIGWRGGVLVVVGRHQSRWRDPEWSGFATSAHDQRLYDSLRGEWSEPTRTGTTNQKDLAQGADPQFESAFLRGDSPEFSRWSQRS
jgi:hypothetical protein